MKYVDTFVSKEGKLSAKSTYRCERRSQTKKETEEKKKNSKMAIKLKEKWIKASQEKWHKTFDTVDAMREEGKKKRKFKSVALATKTCVEARYAEKRRATQRERNKKDIEWVTVSMSAEKKC